MSKVNLLRCTALGALFCLCGCASYQASSAYAPVSPATPAPSGATPENAEPPPPTLEPRLGVHKPSDDTRIHSGAGDAEPMH